MGEAATARRLSEMGFPTLHFHGALSGLVREEQFQGRSYLVAPVVLVKEMVLGDRPGVPGEFLPADEIVATAEHLLWEGKPVTIDHPKVNGQWTSAGVVAAAEASQVGRLQNVEAVENGAGELRLVGEAWIDVEVAGRIDGGAEILSVLEQFRTAEVPPGTRPLEVSTGYWADREDRGGTFNGHRYASVQRNVVPDHLALLPGGVGKCSLADGCGFPRLNATGEALLPATVEMCGEQIATNVLASARTPTFDDTSTDAWSKPSLSDFISARGWDASTWADLSAEQKASVVATTLLGEVEDTFAASLVFPVVDANGVLFETALRAVLGGRGSQADVPVAALESARAKATSLLNSEFDAGIDTNESVGWRVIRVVANALGIEIAPFEGDRRVRSAAASDSDILELLAALLEERFGEPNAEIWVADVYQQDGLVVFQRQEGGGPSGYFRIGFAVGGDGDVTLDAGDPIEVTRMTTYEPVGNEADAEGEEEDETHEGENGTMELNETQRAAIVAALVACAACEYEEATLNALTDGDLVAIGAARGLEVDGVDFEALTAGETAEELSTEEDPATSGGAASATSDGAATAGGEDGGAAEPATNADEEEIPLDRLPAAVRAIVENASAERNARIDRLVENERCRLTRDTLDAMGDDALEQLEETFAERSYRGRGGAGSRQNSEGGSYIERNPRTPSIVTRKPAAS